MSKKLVLALAAMLLSAGCAKVVVVPVKTGEKLSDGSLAKLEKEGLFYALPKTVVRVGLKIDKTTKEDAPFSKFAAIFAPDGQRVCKPQECVSTGEGLPTKTEFAVQQGAVFSTFGEPDPDQVFLVEFVGRGAIDQALSMTWNEAGLLSAASSTVTNRSVDVALSGLKLVTGLGTKAAFGAPAAGDPATPPSPPTRCEEAGILGVEYSENDKWILPILAQDERARAALQANYCALDKKERKEFREQDAPLLRRAIQAYVTQVLPFANRRLHLLQEDSQALDPVPLIDKLDTLIDQKLRALYLGSTKTETWDGALNVRDLRLGAPIELFKIAPKGICPPQSGLLAPDSKPIPAGFLASSCDAPKPVGIALSYFPAEDQQVFHTVKNSVGSPKGERSFRYRLPAQVTAVLDYDQKTYGGGVLSIAQFGHVVSLPANRNSKALTYDLAMIEATGGLKSFKLGSTGALDAASLDAVAAAGGTVLDARNAARKTEETAADELTILTREQAILKLRDDICTIQKKYGRDCTIEP
jgi:hypothetical protein